MEKLDKNDARKVDSKNICNIFGIDNKIKESGVSNIETASILGLSKLQHQDGIENIKRWSKALKVQKLVVLKVREDT